MEQVGNKWKIAFISLLTLFLLFIIICVIIFTNGWSKQKQSVSIDQYTSELNSELAVFTLETNKDKLNQLIHQYVQKENKKENMKYSLRLEDQVELDTFLTILEQEVPMKLTFKPVVTKQGNLDLIHTDFILAGFNLPSYKLLDILKSTYSFPPWAKVDVENNRIRLSFSEINPKGSFKIRVKEFNLPKDKIIFSVFYAPK